MKTGEKNQHVAELSHSYGTDMIWQFSAIPWLAMLKDRCLNLADQNEGNWHKDQDI